MICGALNYTITIEKEVTSKNAVGSPVETYAFFKKTQATIKYNSGDTQYNEGAQAVSSIDFSIRFDSAIDYKCRVVFESEYYKIIAIEKIGRKDGLRLKCIVFES